jgi:hypothetical protein
LDPTFISTAIELAGFPTDGLHALSITGQDPIFDTPLHLGAGAAIAIAATGLSANRLWTLPGRRPQQLAVDIRHAAASLVSFAFVSLEGTTLEPFIAPVVTDLFPCRDQRWIHLHAGLDKGRSSLEFLGLRPDADKDDVRRATSALDFLQLEESLARHESPIGNCSPQTLDPRAGCDAQSERHGGRLSRSSERHLCVGPSDRRETGR